MHGKRSVTELLGDEIFHVRLRVRDADIVFIKSILEASEGLGAIFAEPRGVESRSSGNGGAIVIAGPRSRATELRELIDDVRLELGGALWDDDPSNAIDVARD